MMHALPDLRYGRIIQLALFCFALLPALARGADWPQWGGQDARNQVSPEAGLPDTFEPGKKRPDGSGIDLATTKNVKWVARLGNAAYVGRSSNRPPRLRSSVAPRRPSARVRPRPWRDPKLRAALS